MYYYCDFCGHLLDEHNGIGYCPRCGCEYDVAHMRERMINEQEPAAQTVLGRRYLFRHRNSDMLEDRVMGIYIPWAMI